MAAAAASCADVRTIHDAVGRWAARSESDERDEGARGAVAHSGTKALRGAGGAWLTFGELWKASGAVSRALALPACAEAVVGVCASGLVAISTMLGVMRRGNAYLPLDPGYPASRLAFMAHDARVACVVVTPGTRAAWDAAVETGEDDGMDGLADVRVVEVAEDELVRMSQAPTLAADMETDPTVSTEALAYILYTSGSTGRPKGVCGTHGAMLNRFRWMWGACPFDAGEVACAKTALNFVDSIFEIFGALGAGIPLVIVPSAAKVNAELLVDFLSEHRVTRLIAVPSLLRAMLAAVPDLGAALSRVRFVTCSGEALPYELVSEMRRALPWSTLINLYGSTEVAADVTCQMFEPASRGEADSTTLEADSEDHGPLAPIGVAIDNTEVVVVHPDTLVEEPDGEIGEFLVAGANLARGYLRRPEETSRAFLWLRAEQETSSSSSLRRFVPCEARTEGAQQWFRTGDFGYRSKSSSRAFNFTGRRDQQVKVRGHRVELFEVEEAVKGCPGVSGAVVVALHDPVRLVMYLTPVAQGATAGLAAVKLASSAIAHLESRLPEYMVPSRVFVVTEFPQLPNGKLDRKSMVLPVSDPRNPAHGQSVDGLLLHGGVGAADAATFSTLSETQQLVARCWSSLLRVPAEAFNADSSFITCGGDSLLTVHLTARLREEAGLPAETLPVAAIASARTLRHMAETVDRASQARDSVEIAGKPQSKRPGALRVDASIASVTLAQYLEARVPPMAPGAPRAEDIEKVYPLSSLQRGLLFISLASSGAGGAGAEAAGTGGAYVEQLKYRIRGAIAVGKFHRCWREMTARHPVLRSSFDWWSLDGAVQVVYDPEASVIPLNYVDLRGDESSAQAAAVESFLQEDRQRGIDLRVPGLLRLYLAHVADDEWTLVLTIHHLLFDGWSLDLILQELAERYRSPSANLLDVADTKSSLAFDEYVNWEASVDTAEAEAYWNEVVSSVPPARSGRSGAADASLVAGAAESATHVLSDDSLRGLQRAGVAAGVTVGSVLHAVWSIVYWSYCESDQAGFRDTSSDRALVYGATSSGRAAPIGGIEGMVGPLMRSFPVVMKRPGAGNETFVDLVRRMHATLLEGIAHDTLPLPEIQSIAARQSGERGPLFEALVNVEPAIDAYELEEGVSLSEEGIIDSIGYPLSVRASVAPNKVSLLATAESSRYSREFLAKLLLDIERVAARMLEEPTSVRVGQLVSLLGTRRRDVVADSVAPQATFSHYPGAFGLSDAPQMPWLPDASDKAVARAEVLHRRWTLNSSLRESLELRAHSLRSSLQTVVCGLFSIAVRRWSSSTTFGMLMPSDSDSSPSAVHVDLRGAGRGPLRAVLTAIAELCRSSPARSGNGGHSELVPTLYVRTDEPVSAIPPPPAPGAKHMRLVCFPYGGGTKSLYKPWHDKLEEMLSSTGASIEIVAIDLPGHGTLRSQQPLKDMDLLVNWCLEQLADVLTRASAGEVPYAMVGYSFGGLVAFEVARAAEARGFAAPAHLFVASIAAPSRSVPDADPGVDDVTLVRDLQKVGQVSPEVVEAGPTAWPILLGPMRADLWLEKGYMLQQAAEFDVSRTVSCTVTAVLGESDSTIDSVDDVQAWSEHTTGSFHLRKVPGGHMFAEEEPASRDMLLGMVAHEVSSSLVAVREVARAPERPTSALSVEISHTPSSSALEFDVSAVRGALPDTVVDGFSATLQALAVAVASREDAWDAPWPSLLPPQPPAVPVAPPRPLDPRLLHEPYLAKVAESPDRPAVIGVGTERRVLSFADVDSIARRVARFVAAASEETGGTTAVFMHKCWQQIPAVLGILGAGRAYVPLDAKLPSERVKELLVASRCLAVVTTAGLFDSTEGELLQSGEVSLPVVVVDGADVRCTAPLAVGDADIGSSKASPGDLAYVIYTSGSTGVPKGVCCHHRGAINTNTDLIERFSIGADDRVLALSSMSFDLSVFDVFGLLGAGGALVVPSGDFARPDPEAWMNLVKEHRVSVWNTVPAFMELVVSYLEAVNRKLPSSIRVIMMSGDWIPLTLAERIRNVCADRSHEASIRIISLGGATEAAIWSNMHEIGRELDPAWTSIPYGRPLRNQTMYILDDDTMEHCQEWVTGVIYIGGSGTALGYFGDPERTAKQFLKHPKTGEYLFRTGDLGRLRGGLLEILGREDTQVKVNGYRIELGEIESVACENPSIAGCCAVVVGHPGAVGGRHVVAFVTCRSDQSSAAEESDAPALGGAGGAHEEQVPTIVEQTSLVDDWQNVFDAVYDKPGEAPIAAMETAAGSPFFDLSGWTDSYTGRDHEAEVMSEWLHTTSQRLLLLRPRRVLEIGFGTGMLLHNLNHSGEVEAYCGTDVSHVAVERMQRLLRDPSVGAAPSTVDVRVIHADGTSTLRAVSDAHAGSAPTFDTVVCNSVAQYFPDEEYLHGVLEQAVSSVAAGGCVFMGDVRSLPLLRCFHVSITQAKAQASTWTVGQLVGAAERSLLVDKELCVDPRLFVGLVGRKGSGVVGVRTLVRRGRLLSELTKFRYDVVLHVGTIPPVVPSSRSRTLRWTDVGSSVSGIDRELASIRENTAIDAVIVLGIPNGRILDDVALEEVVVNHGHRSPSSLLESLREETDSVRRRLCGVGDAADIEDIFDAASGNGYSCEVSWGGGGLALVDAVFVRRDRNERMLPLVEGFPGHAHTEWGRPDVAATTPMVNNPGRAQTVRAMVPSVRAMLEERLPVYMVPRTIVAVPSLPLTGNGKVDRKRLVAIHTLPDASAKEGVSGKEAGGNGDNPMSSPAGVRLAKAWADVLGVPQSSLTAESNFFSLGGDSLASLRLVNACARAGLRISVAQVLETPVFGDLASTLQVPTLAAPVPAALFAVNSDPKGAFETFPLIGIQRAYWIGQQLSVAASGGREVANPHVYLEYEVPAVAGGVADLLSWVVRAMVTRHPMLRAVMTADGRLQILPPNDPSIQAWRVRVEDPARSIEAVRADITRPGPSASVWPPFDVRLSDAGAAGTHARVYVAVSLFVMDGVTEQILRREVAWLALFASAQAKAGLLEEPALPPPAMAQPSITFRDYAIALNRFEQSSTTYATSMKYWERRMPVLPPPPGVPLRPHVAQALQEGAAMPTASSSGSGVRHFQGRLGAKKWAAVKATCQSIGVTPTTALATMYAQVLAHWGSSSHFLINVMHTMRHPVHPHVSAIVGNFSSTILLEARVSAKSASGSFADDARKLTSQLARDLEHCIVSGVDVMQALNKSRREAFRAVAPYAFTCTLGLAEVAGMSLPPVGPAAGTEHGSAAGDSTGAATHEDPVLLDAVAAARQTYSQVQTPHTWLDHQVEEEPGTGELMYNFDFLDGVLPSTVMEGIVSSYMELLAALAEERDNWMRPVSGLWSDPTPAAPLGEPCPVDDRLLHVPFTTHAGLTPMSLALVDENETSSRALAYSELLNAVRHIGAAIVRSQQASGGAGGDGPDTVAVYMHKGWEQVAAVLGILSAGMAYVPLDARLPAERVRDLLNASGAVAVVTSATVSSGAESEVLGDAGLPVIVVDEAWVREPLLEECSNLGPVRSPDELAYLIYTSGSTGVPKGVACHHRGAMNTITDLLERFGIGAGDRVLALSSLSFDLSVFDIFGLLAAGGAVVVPSGDYSRPDPEAWLSLAAKHSVTVWNTVPAFMELVVSYLEAMKRKLPASLRLVMMSGDWIPRNLAARIRAVCAGDDHVARIRVVSLGGATEAAVWSNMHEIGHDLDPEWSSIPYGRPLRNQTMYVLDDETMQHCEPWVTGVIYIGGAGVALGYFGDDERTTAQFVEHPRTGERLFRTGDLGRLRPGGLLEILGREDTQVKVNGFRIELGEIEATLQSHPAVASAVCDVFGSAIAAYFVFADSASDDASEGLEDALVALCKRHLPPYMVPRFIIPIEEIPLTWNGKVMRSALPSPAPAGTQLGRGRMRSSASSDGSSWLGVTSPSDSAGGSSRRHHSHGGRRRRSSGSLRHYSAGGRRHSSDGRPSRRSSGASEATFADDELGAVVDVVSSAFAVVLMGDESAAPSMPRGKGFFDLGGDSLSALRLLVELQGRLRVTVSISTLFEHQTISKLARAVQRSRAATVGRQGATRLEQIVLQEGEPGVPPLFLVHPAGASALCYRGFAAHVDARRPVIAIDDPALREPPVGTATSPVTGPEGGFRLHSIEEAAAAVAQCVVAYASQRGSSARDADPLPPTSCLLGGWSYGGVVAAEAARVLRELETAVTVERVLLLDAPIAPEDRLADIEPVAEEELATLGDAALAPKSTDRAGEGAAGSAPGTSSLPPANADAATRAAEHFAHCTLLLRAFEGPEVGGLDVPILSLVPPGGAACHVSVKRFTTAECEERVLPRGTHWSVVSEGGGADVAAACAGILNV